MIPRTFVAVISMLGLLLPAISFAQGGQQERQPYYGQQQSERQQQPRISADVRATAMTQLSDEEARALSLAPGWILKHLHQARRAIAYQQGQEALGHVRQRLMSVRIIE